MDPARWDRIQDLFHAAAGLPAGEREAFVRQESGDDAPLAAEVLSLLEEAARSGTLLDRGLAGVAGEVLGGSAPAPRELGPYRVLRVIGEGGRGVCVDCCNFVASELPALTPVRAAPSVPGTPRQRSVIGIRFPLAPKKTMNHRGHRGHRERQRRKTG